MASAKDRKKRAFRKSTAAAQSFGPIVVRKSNPDPAAWGPNDRPVYVAPPALTTLLTRGVIDSDQYRAGEEIQEVFTAVTAGLHTRAADPNRAGGGNGKGDMSDRMLRAYLERYRPWSDQLSGIRAVAPSTDEMERVFPRTDVSALREWSAQAGAARQPRAGKSYHQKTLAFVIALVVDSRSIEQIAREEGHADRTVKAAILAGLMLYAEISGWVRRAA